MISHAFDAKMPTVLDTRVVTGSGGGPEKTILNSPRFLAGAGYRMLCAYMHPPGDPGFERLRDRAKAWQAPLLSVPDRGVWDWRVASELLHICRRERVAIWHGHDYKSNALGLLLRRFWPMRLVTTVHGWVHQTQRTPVYYAIDRLCLRHYEAVLCVSADLQARCLKFGVPAARCALIENGIDAERYARRLSVENAKGRLGLPAGRLLVGAVGRLSAEKGFDVLIRAADRLLRQGIDLELWIAGEGHERRRLDTLIAELERKDRIRLLGFVSDLDDLYQAMDVFALSSLAEGLPNVVLEAMAMEVPVVATRIAGVPQLLHDGANGLLVEPGDAHGLCTALARVLTDTTLGRRLGRTGRRTIERSQFSFPSRMERIGAVYDRLLGPPRR